MGEGRDQEKASAKPAPTTAAVSTRPIARLRKVPPSVWSNIDPSPDQGRGRQ